MVNCIVVGSGVSKLDRCGKCVTTESAGLLCRYVHDVGHR